LLPWILGIPEREIICHRATHLQKNAHRWEAISKNNLLTL